MKRKINKKINQRIESEVAISIILGVSLFMGSIIWIQNSRYYISTSDVRDKAMVTQSGSVVFLGDSITAIGNWNKIFGVSYIANAGVSGNTTDNVIARLSSAIKYQPQKLFLMIGINDLFQGKDVAYISKNYEIILNRIQSESPNTVIYLQSVLPVNSDISKLPFVDSQKIVALNQRIKLFADGKKIIFIDLYPYFCGVDNKLYRKYSNDGVHPGASGYIIWRNVIKPYLN